MSKLKLEMFKLTKDQINSFNNITISVIIGALPVLLMMYLSTYTIPMLVNGTGSFKGFLLFVLHLSIGGLISYYLAIVKGNYDKAIKT